MKNNFKKLVCIQGLGYVGSAMCACVASAHDTAGNNYFDVVGVDLNTKKVINIFGFGGKLNIKKN